MVWLSRGRCVPWGIAHTGFIIKRNHPIKRICHIGQIPALLLGRQSRIIRLAFSLILHTANDIRSAGLVLNMVDFRPLNEKLHKKYQIMLDFLS